MRGADLKNVDRGDEWIPQLDQLSQRVIVLKQLLVPRHLQCVTNFGASIRSERLDIILYCQVDLLYLMHEDSLMNKERSDVTLAADPTTSARPCVLVRFKQALSEEHRCFPLLEKH